MNNTTRTLNVLLVDDDTDTQKVVSTILKFADYPVTVTSNAKDALAYITSHPAPDLILLDIYLPDSDGYQTLAAIRKFLPTVKVIAITAYYTDSSLADSRLKGFNGFLPKPLNPSTLVSSMQQIVQS